jgi:Resolvase, N terminal domain
MKAAIYARVSTADNGQDPTMQTRELREYCERRGWAVAGEYADIGISGTKGEAAGAGSAARGGASLTIRSGRCVEIRSFRTLRVPSPAGAGDIQIPGHRIRESLGAGVNVHADGEDDLHRSRRRGRVGALLDRGTRASGPAECEGEREVTGAAACCWSTQRGSHRYGRGDSRGQRLVSSSD